MSGRAANKPTPIRIGVLCGGSGLTAWQVQCLQQVQELPFAEFVVVVVESQPPRRRTLVQRVRDKLSSGLLLWRAYERFVLEPKSSAMRHAALPAELNDVHRLECVPITQGKYRQRFDDHSLDALRAYDIDVLLRFGFGILSGEILNLPRYGIWSFHHGDPDHFRGAPPGFWEICEGSAVTGVVLQRLTEKLDDGIILQSGWFKTVAENYPKSLDSILFGATHFVSRVLVELNQSPERLTKSKAVPARGQIYRYPRSLNVLRFLAKTTRAWLAAQFQSLFRHQQWTVGFIEGRPAEIFASISGAEEQVSKVRWLPERPGHFLADPFVVPSSESKAGALILAEDFDWSSDRGHIAALKVHEGNLVSHSHAIQLDAHLSYPYVIVHDGQTYCVPESAEAGEVCLYQLRQADGRWIKHRTILTGFPAVDPTLFTYDGRWWLFCTSAETGPNEFLYAWHADDLAGDWTPHLANPVKVDIRSARPAGQPFVHDGALIRPAQDCSNGYGRGIVFNRVTKLTDKEFAEQEAAKLRPETGTYSAGLHTISGAGEITVIDGARQAFIGAEFGRALRKKFGRDR